MRSSLSTTLISSSKHLWSRFGYRPWAKLLHHFDLHHTRRIGPMEDGVIIHRCEWCGVSRTEVPLEVTRRRMKEHRDEVDVAGYRVELDE